MKPKRIVLADGDRMFRARCREELEDEGYAVWTASSAAEALEAVRRERPDLVLLDLRLPCGGLPDGGLRALRQILDADDTIPVILMSDCAFSCEESFLTWIAAACVEKSGSLAVLTDRVRGILSGEALEGAPGTAPLRAGEREPESVTDKL